MISMLMFRSLSIVVKLSSVKHVGERFMGPKLSIYNYNK